MCLRILVQVLSLMETLHLLMFIILLISILMLMLMLTIHFSQAGANINSACGPRGEGRTPLHIAAEHGHMVNAQVSYPYKHWLDTC